MSIASSVTCSTTSSGFNQEPMNPRRYVFVQHSDNVNASSTRRAVRSHAMSAVRRLQRQENANPIRLKWPREYSVGRTTGRTTPDGQPAGFDDQFGTLQSTEPIQIQRQEVESIGDTPQVELSELLDSADGHNSSLMDFQNSIGPQTERARSFYFSERQGPQPYTTEEVEEKNTPTFTLPQTPLGAGRLDPFQTSSIHINRSLAQLIDHCVLPCFHSYKAPNHIYFYALVPLIKHRPDHHACNVLWRTMSQTNSY